MNFKSESPARAYKLFQTPFGALPAYGSDAPKLAVQPGRDNIGATRVSKNGLNALFDDLQIGNGSVLSFHHHYRDGDRLLNAVVGVADDRGLKDLTIMASSIFPVHAPIVSSIQNGTIKNIICDYMRGPVADAVAQGQLNGVAMLQSHGGRARAITARQIEIDVAFIAAPLAHSSGALTGRGGALACGPLGYAAVDASYARRTVAAVHEITSEPLAKEDIPGHLIDVLLHFQDPGDSAGIQSGSTVPNTSPTAQMIAAQVVDVIEAAGLMRDGLSLQSGAGGYSLGAVPAIGRRMADLGVTGSFMSGGITGAHTAVLEAGLFRRIRDVQCFDAAAVQSSIYSDNHHMMTAAEYASPLQKDACVDDLSVMLLGAVQVDRNFNVNVVKGGNGSILGGPGGHPDTAQGASVSIVTTTLTGGGYAKIVDQVECCCTIGDDIDVVVTDFGIAVNSTRPDIAEGLRARGVAVEPIDALIKQAAEQASRTTNIAHTPPADSILVEHRNGTILETI